MKAKSATAIEIKLHDQVVKIPVKDVILNDWNPNFVPSDIKDAIKDDIEQNGFIGPIVIQKYNERMKKKNVIINGEHRFKTLKEMGGKEVPVVIVDVDDEMAQVLTIRLNREHGELLPNKVGDVLNNIAKKRKNDMEYLQKITYLRQKDLEAIMDLRNADMENILSTKKSVSFTAKTKMVECPQCNHKFEV
jgi:ParB-like chromosome segregation protein Spo0J